MPDNPAPEVQSAKEEATKPCTCLGTCKGAAGLGAGWHCVMERRLPESEQDVHTEHCCRHSCKYGSEDCPVENRQKPQSFPCEDCEEVWDEEEQAKLDALRIENASLRSSLTAALADKERELEEKLTEQRRRLCADHDETLATLKRVQEAAKTEIESLTTKLAAVREFAAKAEHRDEPILGYEILEILKAESGSTSQDDGRKALFRLGKALLESRPPDDIGPSPEVEEEYYAAMDEVKRVAVVLAGRPLGKGGIFNAVKAIYEAGGNGWDRFEDAPAVEGECVPYVRQCQTCGAALPSDGGVYGFKGGKTLCFACLTAKGK